MSVYKFQAKTVEGKMLNGEVEASNEQEARVKIRAQQLIPLRVISKEVVQKTGFKFLEKKVKPKELQVFTRQFSVLIGSGVPIVQSLEAMISTSRTPKMNNTLTNIVHQVEQGRRLGDVLSNHSDVFDKMYVSLIKAGEEGGVLDTILNRLAEYIESSVQLKRKVVGALWYPGAIVIVAILVITGILVFVIPSFSELFARGGQDLPLLTQKVLDLSGWIQKYWYLFIGGAVMIPWSIMQYYKTDDGKKSMDSFFLRLPIFGDLLLKASVARFARTLATLLAAGVRITEALDIAADTAGNAVIEETLMDAKGSIMKGRVISEPLKASPHIPDMVAQMISVGEQSGNMDQMLNKVADFYEDEVSVASETLTSLIEPILMVVLGGIIAVLVVAMYLPIFNIADLSGGQ